MYGFESEPGSDRLFPWILYDLDYVRDYLNQGGPWHRHVNNADGVGYAVFRIDRIIEPGFLVASGGLDPKALGPGRRLRSMSPNPWGRCALVSSVRAGWRDVPGR